MDRQTILDLLLKDHTHDALIDSPELYSIEEDIYQWMFETRDYWNERIPRLTDHYRKEGEELKKEDPEYYWRYCTQYYTEENIHRRADKRYRRECGYARSHFYGQLAKFWRVLLTKRPEFADRCPWHAFRGDMIWMSLQDDEFCNAIGIPKKEIALKMPLKIMSSCDWDELLKIVPELKAEKDKLIASGYKFEAYCL